MKSIYVLTVLTALTGCIAPQQSRPIFPISAVFDLAQATRLMAEGRNTIKGNAFLRQRGGGVVTCAGAEVLLVPATAYAKERFLRIYGDKNVSRQSIIFEPNPVEYLATTKNTKCDSQGNFVFERIADGDFFVTTRVTWENSNTTQGGAIFQAITVKDGQTANLVLTN